VFCSTTCRLNAHRREVRINLQCVYCGLVGDSIDHVPPSSVRPSLLDLGLAKRYPFVEVRACQECNSALSNRALWTVGARKEYIKRFLRARYRRFLKIPSWSDRELGALDPHMREHVLQGLDVRDLIKARIAF
jgi:5-methylcytosine-specific restriction endonuclease McrA